MPVTETFHLSSVAAPGLAAMAGALWVSRRRRHGASGRFDRSRAGAWAAATILFLIAMAGPLDWLGERRLMSAHMVQHILLLSVIPGLVIFAWPRQWSDATISGTAAAGCLLGGVGAIWLLHLPMVLEAGLDSSWLHEGQHLVLLAAGILIALPLTAAGYGLGFAAAFYLVAAELSIGALGIWLAWSPELIYTTYGQAPRTWGLSPETDQALAGALLLVSEEPFLAVEFAVVFIRALGSEEADDD